MALSYTTRARVDLLLGSEIVADLLLAFTDSVDLTDDVFADLMERAGNWVNGALASKYVVPVGAFPNTPPLVSDITDYKLAELLYSRRHADGQDAKYYERQVEQALGPYVKPGGTSVIPGMTLLPASQSAVGILTIAPDPVFGRRGIGGSGGSGMSGW